MTSIKNIFALMFCFLALPAFGQEASSQLPLGTMAIEYTGVYKSGDALFPAKTRVKIMKSGASYEIMPNTSVKGETPLSLSLANIRGSTLAGNKGIWIYWFDASDATKMVYIELDGGAANLSSSLNKDVADYNNRPALENEAQKARYDEYRERALKESR